MDINKKTRREDFLKSFEGLQKNFDASLQAAKSDEKNFKNKCTLFQRNIDTYLKEASNRIAESNPLSQQMSIFSETIQITNASWKTRIARQDTGIRFREGFDDSLMVFVYGKVKSGKSSLGNYIAWGHTDPTINLKKQTPNQMLPLYFSGEKTNVRDGDVDKEAESNKEFRVGATEATSTIQGFCLPGLTWIDSPGLHSKNQENDRLARDYVKHSDLILYTMKSDAPGRASDLEEIKDLYQTDKRFLLLLTGSDEIEHDWNDETETQIDTLVMKSQERRKSQRDYIRNELNNIEGLKNNLDNIEIISFSARYAQEHQDSSEAFSDSGMNELFNILEEVAQSNGVKLKQQVPLNGFINFLGEFDKDVEKYSNLIDDFSNNFARLDSEISNKLFEKKINIKRDVSDLIREYFKAIPDEYRDNNYKMNDHIIALIERVKGKQVGLINEAIQNLLQEFSQGFGDNVLTIIDNSNLYELPEFEIETQKRKRVTKIIKGTRTRNSGIGSLLGTAAGFLVGGPVGAAVGGIIGGAAGSAVGKSASAEEDEFYVNIGDNLAEIEKNFIEIMKKSTERQIDEYKANVFDSFLKELHYLIKSLKAETIEMSDYLLSLSKSIELQLNKING